MIYGATWILYLVSDVLYLVAFFALYYALRQAGRSIATIAVALNTSFVAIDVAVDIPLRLWLIALSRSYVTAGSNGQQLVTAANFAISTSNDVALVATILQFVALIFASFLMTKVSAFGRHVAYLGVASGVVALLFVPAFIAGTQLAGLLNIAGFALLTIWSVAVGVKLRRLFRVTKPESVSVTRSSKSLVEQYLQP